MPALTWSDVTTASGVERPVGEAIIQVDMTPPAGSGEQKFSVKGEHVPTVCAAQYMNNFFGKKVKAFAL